MKIPRVTELRVLDAYVLEVVFADGTKRSVALGDELNDGILAPLKDPALFAQAFIDGVGVGWPNGASFSPEFLYNDAKIPARQSS